MVVQTVESFETLVENLQASTYAVVDFYAQWCGPCKTITPMYIELSEVFSSIPFYKVDIDEVKEVIDAYTVTNLPTFMIFHQGKVIIKAEGNQALKKIKEELGSLREIPNKDTLEPNQTNEGSVKPAAFTSTSKLTNLPKPEFESKTDTDHVLSLNDLQDLVQNKPTNILFFPFVADPASLKPPKDPNQPTPIRTVNIKDVEDIVAKTKYASSTQVIEINHLQSVDIAKKYGIISEETPTMKILHKGIHFATVNFGSLNDLHTKLEKLTTIYA